MHRADPVSRPPSPHRRGHRDHPPHGAPVSSLLEPPDPARDTQAPRRAQVTLRPLPERPPLLRGYRPSAFGWIAVILWAIIILTIVWPHGHR